MRGGLGAGGMRDGLEGCGAGRPPAAEKGREKGWEKGREVKGPSGEAGQGAGDGFPGTSLAKTVEK